MGFFLFLLETLICEMRSFVVGVADLPTVGDGGRRVDFTGYKRCCDATSAWRTGRHMGQSRQGPFQMLVNLKDTHPYYANLILNILIITTCGYFLLMRLRLVH